MDSHLGPGSISSISELANLAGAAPAAFQRLFTAETFPAAALRMSERGARDASAVLNARRAQIEEQALVVLSDRHLDREALFNPLRAHRVRTSNTDDAAELIDRQQQVHGCRWCDRGDWHVENESLWVDDFGAYRSADGRFAAGPNWARQAPISGLAIGDERTHNLLRLNAADFVSLFVAAEEYIQLACRARPECTFFMIILNGGPKSAASVWHAHLQIVGRFDRHFRFARHVNRLCPPDYWDLMWLAHEGLGLTFGNEDGCGWVNVCPVKERDITAASLSLQAGARLMYDVLQRLIRQGTNNFSLGAILSPPCAGGGPSAKEFARWPRVLWRFVDRGDMRVTHSDWGSIEMLAESSVVACDPFTVAPWLQHGLSSDGAAPIRLGVSQ